MVNLEVAVLQPQYALQDAPVLAQQSVFIDESYSTWCTNWLICCYRAMWSSYHSILIPFSCSLLLHCCCSRVEAGHSCHREVWWLSTYQQQFPWPLLKESATISPKECILVCFFQTVFTKSKQNHQCAPKDITSVSSKNTISTAVWQCEILFGMLLHWPSHFPTACWATSLHLTHFQGDT